MRGKLPRSFKVNSGDPLYGTDAQTDAYLYDAALAIIATVGTHRNDLAYEILSGVILSQTDAGKFPFVANHTDATTSTLEFPNQTMALMAYAIGYYLEMNPSTANFCTIELTLRNTLQLLQVQRGWLYHSGLIYNGNNGFIYDYGVRTETNVLAYFAFKQAAKVLNNTYYSTTANELKDAINAKLWDDDKLNYGLSTVGVLDSTNKLEVFAYGSIFYSEIGDNVKALNCLTKCEVFATVDENSGAVGYTAFIGSPENVWFEMSYTVAVAYYRANNLVKYNQIVNELNRYVELDGGFKGTLVKAYTTESLIGYEAVGSTAWSLIANFLKGSAFKIRTTVSPATGCTVPFYSVARSYSFSKTGCPVDTHPSSITYTVPVGRYISYVDQVTADGFATTEITTFAQAYVNLYGTCIPDAFFGNEYQSDFFTKNNCSVGYHGSVAIVYEVLANTYYAATLIDANNLALADITANGQTYANTYGSCVPDASVNILYVVLDYDILGNLTAQAFSTLPTNTDVTITYRIKDGMDIYHTGYPGITILSGNSSSSIGIITSPGTTSPYTAEGTAVSPTSHGGTMIYTYS